MDIYLISDMLNEIQVMYEVTCTDSLYVNIYIILTDNISTGLGITCI